MKVDEAHTFAREWVEVWNAHDLESILAHFTDDVIFTSPFAEKVVPASEGIIRGKAALREYWREGLRLIPDLHFEIIGVYLGVDAIVIHYRNQLGRLVCEVLFFRGSLVERGLGTYLDDSSSMA